MAFEEFHVDPPVEDEQAGIPRRLYRCTDGEMRDAYERIKFESRVKWGWLGWTLTPQ